MMNEAGSLGERGQAERLLSESLERFRQMKDPAGMSRVLNSAGEWARVDGDYPRAIDAYEESLALAYKTVDNQCIATTQTNLAYVLYHRGGYDARRLSSQKP